MRFLHKCILFGNFASNIFEFSLCLSLSLINADKFLLVSIELFLELMNNFSISTKPRLLVSNFLFDSGNLLFFLDDRATKLLLLLLQ